MSNKKTNSTIRLVQLSILIALQAVLTFTPIGFIMVGPVAITLMHIPVIVGAIVMGPLYGGILGLSFGLMSMIKATTAAVTPVDLLFTPVSSPNPIASIVMCILPRVLLGVIAAYVYILIKKWDKKNIFAMPVSALVSTALHTILVLGCLSLFFDQIPLKEVFLTVVGINGLLEIALAMIIASAICKPLIKISKRQVS